MELVRHAAAQGESATAGSGEGYAVVVVNWNGWADVLECLESVYRSSPPPDVVVVCDNGSTDGSLERIRDWANGLLSVHLPPDHPHRASVNPGVDKPIPFVEYDRPTAERGGPPGSDVPGLVLISTGGNLGFAGGNNVGLRYLLARGGDSAIWLLNPDTVVDRGAARALLAGLHAPGRVGMCGSTVRYYERPELNQALGGAVHLWWLAYPRHLGEGTPASVPGPEAVIARNMAYVYAASMMMTRDFLRRVGMLDESYFLFFEELDLAMRGRRQGFELAYAPASVVYHRGGASVEREGSRSVVADYYFLRNRIRVTRKYRPVALPGAYLAVFVALLRRAWRGEWPRVGAAVRVLLGR